MSRRLSFTENRRRRLAKQPDQFRLEPRTTITEPISLTGLAIAWMRGGVQLGLISPFMATNAPSPISRDVQKANPAQNPVRPAFPPRRNLLAPIVGAHPVVSSAGGSNDAIIPASMAASPGTSGDWLSLTGPATDGAESHGISLPWHPAKPNGGGAAMASRGGSNPASPLRASSRGAITPLQLPASTPGAASGAGGSAALLAAVASASSNGGAAAATAIAAERGAPWRRPWLRQCGAGPDRGIERPGTGDQCPGQQPAWDNSIDSLGRIGFARLDSRPDHRQLLAARSAIIHLLSLVRA